MKYLTKKTVYVPVADETNLEINMKHFPFLHEYKIIGVRKYRDVSWGPAGVDMTKVRKRCACGKIKVENISGYWTREELEGKD